MQKESKQHHREIISNVKGSLVTMIQCAESVIRIKKLPTARQLNCKISLTIEVQVATRKLQLQTTVKRFQFDLHLNLEGQHILVSSWFQR